MECKERFLEKELKAQFTVETVLVFPIVLIVILSVIYITFYVHDRTIIGACAYKTGLESTFDGKKLHSIAKENVNSLQTICIDNTGVFTNENDEQQVKYIGRIQAPFTAMSVLVTSEKVVEEKHTVEKMDLDKMYIFKVAVDKLLK